MTFQEMIYAMWYLILPNMLLHKKKCVTVFACEGVSIHGKELKTSKQLKNSTKFISASSFAVCFSMILDK